MATLNQVMKRTQTKKLRRARAPLLLRCPQKKVFCLKVYVMNPKKPNSANRHVGRVAIVKTKKKFIAHIPGEIHTLQPYSMVLVRGGRVKDLPGVNYKMIRGKYDLQSIKHRRQARSKVGTYM